MTRKDNVTKFSEGQNIGSAFKNFNLSINNNNGLASKVNSSSTIPTRPLNLTLKQLEEKRLKNQCFWCDDKFVLGHRCKNRQIYLLTVENDDVGMKEKPKCMEIVAKENDQVTLINKPYLSLHALEGTFNYQTMRIRRAMGKKSCVC